MPKTVGEAGDKKTVGDQKQVAQGQWTEKTVECGQVECGQGVQNERHLYCTLPGFPYQASLVELRSHSTVLNSRKEAGRRIGRTNVLGRSGRLTYLKQLLMESVLWKSSCEQTVSMKADETWEELRIHK